MGSHRFNEGGHLPTAELAVNSSSEPERVEVPRILASPPVVSWWSAWIPFFAGIVIAGVVGAAVGATLIRVILP